ncbi:Peptide methionine sulfoxide reductase MsrA [Trichoplax sp. H2]|nr:Peptide methionine sulfoxide reductase MsrA [Trichoplax sp. H2]|eukprot:RDD38843.1 Peptide methionine sulfoxide reductase MsrA [Trichoplax sp. H2]
MIRGDHTETIQIEYDPNVISYEELLTKFWTSHNPTSKRSNQYMSAIFYHDAKQEAAAKRSMADRQKHVYRKIVTVIQPAGKFFLAENYHQKYLFRQNRDLSKLLKLSDQDIISSPLVAKLNAVCGNYLSTEELKTAISLNPKLYDLSSSILDKLSAQLENRSSRSFCSY